MSGETAGISIKASQITDLDGAIARLVTAPASAAAAGTAGDISYDATHFYVCIASNTWVRCTLATW